MRRKCLINYPLSILSKKKLSIMSILSGIHNEYQLLERQWHLQINMTGLQAHMKILRTNPQEKKNKKNKNKNKTKQCA